VGRQVRLDRCAPGGADRVAARQQPATGARADGDREALQILLGARDELTVAVTAQTNRLRALLLTGDDTDRQLARGPLTKDTLAPHGWTRSSPRGRKTPEALGAYELISAITRLSGLDLVLQPRRNDHPALSQMERAQQSARS
jgi:hypothetical protein